eukprot:4076752-Prymnesium_polylepis.1
MPKRKHLKRTAPAHNARRKTPDDADHDPGDDAEAHDAHCEVAHVSNGASDRPPSAARPALSARDIGVAACERSGWFCRRRHACGLIERCWRRVDHRMQIVTETSHVTERSTERLRGRRRRRSSRRMRTRPRVPRRLHARAP